jgi:tRNA U34 2-thiouridine synthase MnmA/TrmU
MQNWSPEDYGTSATCPSSDYDLQDAAKVAKMLDIPFTTVPFIKEYWSHVFSGFLDDLAEGERTPNPV